MTDTTKDTANDQVEAPAKEDQNANGGQVSGDTKSEKDENQKKEDADPAPDADRGTLFDMRSKEEIAEEKRLANLSESQRKTEKARKEQEEKRKEAEKKMKEQENRVYGAGTKLRYVGHLGRENIELEEPMNKKQVIAHLQDDYPEVTESRAKFRYDEDKKQIVVTMGSFDKGYASSRALLHRERI